MNWKLKSPAMNRMEFVDKSQTIHTYQVMALLGTLFKPNRKVAQVDHYSTQSIICNAFMFRRYPNVVSEELVENLYLISVPLLPPSNSVLILDLLNVLIPSQLYQQQGDPENGR